MAKLTEKEINRIFKGIYDGDIDIDNLPVILSQYTYDEIIRFVEEGFGETTTPIKLERLSNYKQNIIGFSGAKTFHNVRDLTSMVFAEDGSKRPFKEFREFAQAIDEQYNVRWLKTEQDTAFGMAQNADEWMQIEAEKDIFPLLQYQTALDERVRDEHAEWDNIIRPIDDDFWNTNMPLNGYNCRCRVIRLTEGKKTSLVGVKRNKDEMFNVNPGKVKYIFNEEKHPYFKHKRSESDAFKKATSWQE